MEYNYNDAAKSLLTALGLPETHESFALAGLSLAENRFLKDTKLNFTGAMGSSNLNAKEAALLALSAVANEKHKALFQAFESKAKEAGASEEEIAETYACVGLMTTNNIFYRFRHFMDGNDFYEKQPAGLRMSIMMNPVMGKEFFELMSLVLSAINGCERCVTSHENSVKQHGATDPRIYDAVRLGSVVKSLCTII